MVNVEPLTHQWRADCVVCMFSHRNVFSPKEDDGCRGGIVEMQRLEQIYFKSFIFASLKYRIPVEKLEIIGKRFKKNLSEKSHFLS